MNIQEADIVVKVMFNDVGASALVNLNVLLVIIVVVVKYVQIWKTIHLINHVTHYPLHKLPL